MVKNGFPTLRLMLSAILAFLLCFGGLHAQAFADPIYQDISTEVNISSVDVDVKQGGVQKEFIRDGVIVDPSIEIKVGNSLIFKSHWSISPETMVDLKEGDYFEILLPGTYFNFIASGSSPIYAGSEHVANMELLTSAPKGPRLRLTLTEVGANANELKDGWVTATGQAKQEKSADETVTIGDKPLPGFPITPADPPSGGGITTYPWSPSGPILKNGYQGQQNSLSWFINVNFDEYAKIYSGESITQKQNVVITDKLEAGLVFNAISFYSPYYYPHTDGSLSSSLAYCPELPSNTFTEIVEDSGENYDDFYARVVAAPGPSYGVYQNREIVVSLKSFPDSMNMAYTWDDFLTHANQDLLDGDLTQEQYDNFVHTYKNNFYKTQDTAQLVGLRIGISTTAYGESREVSNDAHMTWNTNDSSSSGTFVQFQSIAGGASMGLPGSVVIRKFDHSSYEKLDGAKFKLQKKNASGTYVDYTPRDSVVERETIDGEVTFEELHYGEYKVVETEAPSGYQDAISFKDDKDTFVIDGTEQGAIFLEAYNYPIPTLSNAVSFAAHKQVTGTASFETRDFHFVIIDMEDESTVAFGKTSISSKDSPKSIDFYTDSSYQNPVTNWDNIFSHGSRYKLKELDGAGYETTYEGGVGEDSNEFIVDSLNADFALSILINNSKDQPMIPKEEPPTPITVNTLPKTSDCLVSTVALTLVFFSLLTLIAALRRKRLRA